MAETQTGATGVTPPYWENAITALSERDAVLRKLIATHRGISLQSRGDAFQTLARSVAGQQISIKAADAVWKKLAARLPEFTPQALTKCEAQDLRACGLSGQKAQYLKDLAFKFECGALREATWASLEDEALIVELTKVNGIGRWTAEMFLLFHLTRPNVFPVDDIGLQRAMSLQYNRGEPVSKLKMRAIAENWLPWRSVATWYLWRSLEPIPVEY